MQYKVHAEIRFASAALRDAAITTVNTTAAGRSMPNAIAQVLGISGVGLVYNGASASAIDAQAVFSAIAGLANKQSPSRWEWHACYAGELVQMCAPTGSGSI